MNADFIVFLCISLNSTPSFSISNMRIAFGVNYKMSIIGITMMWILPREVRNIIEHPGGEDIEDIVSQVYL